MGFNPVRSQTSCVGSDSVIANRALSIKMKTGFFTSTSQILWLTLAYPGGESQGEESPGRSSPQAVPSNGLSTVFSRTVVPWKYCEPERPSQGTGLVQIPQIWPEIQSASQKANPMVLQGLFISRH